MIAAQHTVKEVDQVTENLVPGQEALLHTRREIFCSLADEDHVSMQEQHALADYFAGPGRVTGKCIHFTVVSY